MSLCGAFLRTAEGRRDVPQQFWQEAAISSENWADCLREGWLYTRPRAGRIKKRFYRLTKERLFCFKDQSENALLRSVEIAWKTVTPFYDMENRDFPYGLRLSGEGKKDFYIETSSQLDAWIEALSRTSVMRDIEDDFQVLEEVGRGSYSVVFLTRSLLSPTKSFVIKRIPKATENGKSTLPAIFSEISALRTLSHPSIAALHHVYEADSHVDLIMDFAPCGTLKDKIEKDGRLPRKSVFLLCKCLLEALAYMEKFEIVHRDIKPANVLCVGDGFQLTDFGLAAISCRKMTEKCGSKGFVAPEVLNSSAYDAKVDVYSAGMTILVAAMGCAAGDGRQETGDWDLGGTVRKMLQSDPALRPTASEALALFLSYLDATPKGQLPFFRFPSPTERLRCLRPDKVAVERRSSIESCGSTAPSPSE